MALGCRVVGTSWESKHGHSKCQPTDSVTSGRWETTYSDCPGRCQIQILKWSDTNLAENRNLSILYTDGVCRPLSAIIAEIAKFAERHGVEWGVYHILVSTKLL